MTDERITDLLWARDERAIDALDRECRTRCLLLAKRITGNEEDAKECFNDALERVWESVPPERPRSVRAFLFAVTGRIALEKRRNQRRLKRGGGIPCAPLEELEETAADLRDVEGAYEEKLFSEALDSFLDGLSPRDRALFIERYFRMEDVAALSSAFRLSEAHIYKILSRTRIKLKEYLKKEGFSV